MDTESAPRRSVKSVDRVITILNLFSHERRFITLLEVETILEIHKSSASRLLRQLADAGLLDRIDERTYGVGARIFEIGNLFLSDNFLVRLAGGELSRLSKITSETTQLNIENRGKSVVVASVESPGLVRAAANLGGRLPMLQTASGRMLLSGYDDAALALILERLCPDEDEVSHQLEVIREVRTTGWAISDGEYSADLLAVAAPVFDGRNSLVATISTVSAASAGNQARLEFLRQATVESAHSLSKQFGHSRD